MTIIKPADIFKGSVFHSETKDCFDENKMFKKGRPEKKCLQIKAIYRALIEAEKKEKKVKPVDEKKKEEAAKKAAKKAADKEYLEAAKKAADKEYLEAEKAKKAVVKKPVDEKKKEEAAKKAAEKEYLAAEKAADKEYLEAEKARKAVEKAKKAEKIAGLLLKSIELELKSTRNATMKLRNIKIIIR
jgi:colicin import membrane protein